MTGVEFVANFIATGEFHGLKVGSPVEEVNQVIGVEFLEEIDSEVGSSWRDYGFVEIYFSKFSNWVVTGISLELHRISSNFALASEWKTEMGVDFPGRIAWAEVMGSLSGTPGVPAMECINQGDFIEFRNLETRVSAIVVKNEEECKGWMSDGDVWSVNVS